MSGSVDMFLSVSAGLSLPLSIAQSPSETWVWIVSADSCPMAFFQPLTLCITWRPFCSPFLFPPLVLKIESCPFSYLSRWKISHCISLALTKSSWANVVKISCCLYCWCLMISVRCYTAAANSFLPGCFYVSYFISCKENLVLSADQQIKLSCSVFWKEYFNLSEMLEVLSLLSTIWPIWEQTMFLWIFHVLLVFPQCLYGKTFSDVSVCRVMRESVVKKKCLRLGHLLILLERYLLFVYILVSFVWYLQSY